MPKNKILFSRIFRKLVCAVLILSFLSISTPAAPQEVTGWAVGSWQELRFRFLSSQLAIDGPGWLAAFLAGGDGKSSRTSREIERIQIYPGSINVESGQEAVFSAVAYDRSGEPLSGVNFNWHSSEAESGHPYNDVRGGLFKASEVGIFRVKARARGREAEVLVTVIPRTVRPDGTAIRSTSSRTGLGPVIGISSGDGMVSVVKGGGVDTPSGTPRKDEQTVNNLLPGDGWDNGNWTSFDDPGNQTGDPPGGAADDGAGNGNFQISAPVVSLPGRGIDLTLNLNYNSRLWNKAGTQIKYDIDRGWPAPGWSLGFGKMFFMGTNGGCMLMDADGTRHGYAGQVSSWSTGMSFTGHTSDGALIDYGCNFTYGSHGSGWAKLANGTSISYSTPGPGNDIVYPTRITDAQGNYISISYHQYGEINTITDTLGRVITFHYDSANRLIEIKGPRMTDQDPVYGTATTRTLVRLHYRSLTLNYSFSGVTPVVGNSTPWALDAIYYPATNTGYWFGADPNAADYNTFYSSYGMITKVVEQRGMSWSAGPDEQGTVAQGTVTKQAEYNYPLTTANQSGHTNGLNLGDAPTYTNLKERWHDGVNLTAEAVTTYEVNNNDSWWDPEVMVSNPARSIKIVQPTGVISKQYTHRNPGSWSDGVLFRDETKIVDGGVEKIVASSNVGWQPGNYDSPRPQAVAAVDENGHKVTTWFTYGTGKFNQVTQSCDKDNFGTTLRCTEATYLNTINYIGYFNTSGNFVSGRHILNLVTSTVIKNPSGTVVSRTDYEYDNGSLQETPGVVQHLASHNPHDSSTYTCDCGWSCDFTLAQQKNQAHKGYGNRLMSPPDCPDGSPPWWVCQQCPVFDASTNYRGNVTKVTTYADASTPSGGIEETRAYDITGNVVTVSSSCCEQTTILYDDPLTQNDIDTQYAYPVSQTRGSPDPNSPHRITTSQTYDFNSGLVTSSIDANGRPSTTWFNPDTMRPDKTVASTGAYTTFTYHESDMTLIEEVFEQSGNAAGKTKKYLNGIGKVRKVESFLPGTTTVDIVDTQYTLFGEEWKSSRPYRSGDTIQWSEKYYDAQRRLKKVVEPDGSTTEAFYNSEAGLPDSVSAQPGNRIRVMDAWGRERWGRYDQQGRLIQVVEPNPDRTLNSTGSIFQPGSLLTSYSYDTLGRLIQTDQGVQQRKFKYDDLGRLTRQKLAEQTKTLNDAGVYVGAGNPAAEWANAFFYDSRSNLIQKTDARGVKAHYSFYFWGGGLDPLNRLQRIEYDLSGPHDTSIPINGATPSNFTYMTTGDKTRVAEIDTEYIVNQAYQYDPEGRVSKFTQKIKWREDYPMELNYLYDTLDRVKEVTYPAEYGIPAQGGDPANPRRVVAHTYDTASRLATMAYNGSQHAGGIVYNAAGQTTQLKIGPTGANQVTEDYAFDPQTGLLTNQQAKIGTSSPFINLSYDYARNNAVGSLNGKTGIVTKITDHLNPNKNREYEFDVLGRLVKAKGGLTGNLWNQAYSYDRWGNRTNVTLGAGGVAADGTTPMPLDGVALNPLTPNVSDLAYDQNTNRITSSVGLDSFQYDVNGNLIKALGENGIWLTYEYDTANRLNIIRKDSDQTQLERFQYDHTNARVQSHDPVNDRYKSYLNEGGTTVAEFTEFVVGTPKWSKSHTYQGGAQLATITPDTGGTTEVIEFNHPDRLGTRAKTNQSAGTSSEQAHLPFGRKLDAESSLTTNNRRFTSYDRSEKTALDYASNRTYDSKLGRFTQVDPIGMQAATPMDPQSLNMYSYCGNDPINYIDPSGLFFGSFFRWLGRIIMSLFRSRVARRIAIKFVVNFALSGGNFGVAIRSIIPDILQSTGLFPDPRSTVPWYPGSRLPISLGTSSLSKYIILNLTDRTKLLAAINACIKKVFGAHFLVATSITLARRWRNGMLNLKNTKTGATHSIETGVNFTKRGLQQFGNALGQSLPDDIGGYTPNGAPGSTITLKGRTYSTDGRSANYVATNSRSRTRAGALFGAMVENQIHEDGHTIADIVGTAGDGTIGKDDKGNWEHKDYGYPFGFCVYDEYLEPGSY